MREPAPFQCGFPAKFYSVLVFNCAHYFQVGQRMVRRSQAEPGLKGSGSATFSARRGRFRMDVEFVGMKLFLLAFQFCNQDIEALDAALIARPG